MPGFNELKTLLHTELDSKKYAFQVEKGEVTGKYHIQLYFNLKEKKRLVNVKKLLNGIGDFKQVYVQPAVSESSAFAYCQKEETRILGPFVFPPSL
jgi:hypothetical protein